MPKKNRDMQAQFDPEAGTLNHLELAAEPNPTYIAFSEKTAYSIASELKRKGGIASFTADFQPLNHVVEEGTTLLYALSTKRLTWSMGPNYHKAKFSYHS